MVSSPVMPRRCRGPRRRPCRQRRPTKHRRHWSSLSRSRANTMLRRRSRTMQWCRLRQMPKRCRGPRRRPCRQRTPNARRQHWCRYQEGRRCVSSDVVTSHTMRWCRLGRAVAMFSETISRRRRRRPCRATFTPATKATGLPRKRIGCRGRWSAIVLVPCVVSSSSDDDTISRSPSSVHVVVQRHTGEEAPSALVSISAVRPTPRESSFSYHAMVSSCHHRVARRN